MCGMGWPLPFLLYRNGLQAHLLSLFGEGNGTIGLNSLKTTMTAQPFRSEIDQISSSIKVHLFSSQCKCTTSPKFSPLARLHRRVQATCHGPKQTLEYKA